MSEDRYDVVIIGSGPGGYVCAIRCAQLGLRVACIERYPVRGGTCLNVGCIPSKALLESSERYLEALHGLEAHGVAVGEVVLDLKRMMARKQEIVDQLSGGVELLFKKNKIASITGLARIVDGTTVVVTGDDGDARTLSADAIVIATGSKPTPLPGVEIDRDRIVDSTGALSLPEVPDHLILIGAGIIGLELGSVWGRLGAKVTVLEYLDRILPGIDGEIAKQAKRVFAKQGLTFILGARVSGARIIPPGAANAAAGGSAEGAGGANIPPGAANAAAGGSAEGAGGATQVEVSWKDAAGAEHSLRGDRVLLAIGRRPYTEGLGCEEAGIALDDRGRVIVDELFRTSLPTVFAIGDVIRGPMLAHKAEDEGIAVAEILGGGEGHINYDAVPSIVYTHPEIAAVGKTEEELEAAGVPYVKGRFKYGPNGRALALGEADGLVKILAHAETDRVLGCHIIGARAGDLIAEVALAIEFGASAEDIARSAHAHPTLSEIVREAALDVARRAIHK